MPPNDPTFPPRPVLIGVAGGTGAGKTTLCRAIAARLGPDTALTIAHDLYYRSLPEMPVTADEIVNFDHPNAYDTARLVVDLEALRRGESLHLPSYDFRTHTQAMQGTLTAPRKVILVDGILIFDYPALREMFDLRVFVDAPADVRLARRLLRDIHERKRTILSTLYQYETCVRPMHSQFVELGRNYADLIIPADGTMDAAAACIAAFAHLLAPLETTF